MYDEPQFSFFNRFLWDNHTLELRIDGILFVKQTKSIATHEIWPNQGGTIHARAYYEDPYASNPNESGNAST